MVQFIQDLFLSPFLIFVMLIIVFGVLSWWAIYRRKEYLGYGLGWLIGVFSMVVYGALIGEPEPAAQSAEPVAVTLNILQVIFPSLIGIAFGSVAMGMISRSNSNAVQRSIVVALLTAVSLSVIFLMIVSTAYPQNQRMIGLFSLAFAIGAMTMYAIRRQYPHAIPSTSNPANPANAFDNRQGIPTVPAESASPGDRIRGRISRRR